VRKGQRWVSSEVKGKRRRREEETGKDGKQGSVRDGGGGNQPDAEA
jgi:hypothetical protein